MPKIKVSLFSQVLSILDRNVFSSLVRKHSSDKHSKGINSWTQLVAMLFCQFANANSVREISFGLRSATGNLRHMGVERAPSKSAVSYFNKTRNWELFRDFYFKMLSQLEGSMGLQRRYGFRLKRKIFIMDSTVISLCLKLFDWATYRSQKGAVKLHTILDYDTTLPVFINMTDGKTHDITVARGCSFPKGSILVVDRAYVDYEWLFNLDSSSVFFVIRLKKNSAHEVIEEYDFNDKQERILSDKDIRLTGFKAAKRYPKHLRAVRVYDPVRKCELSLLTNNLSWTANTISELYKARWEIETFFKQVKQGLKIKTFVGTSENAVLIQVWTAMIAILLLKYLKCRAKFGWHLSNLVTVLRMNLFVKIGLWKWINNPLIKNNSPPTNQLPLFLV